MTALAMWRLPWPYLGRQREVEEEEEVVVDVPARVALVPRASPCPPPPRYHHRHSLSLAFVPASCVYWAHLHSPGSIVRFVCSRVWPFVFIGTQCLY
jgi:hypothetical protein